MTLWQAALAQTLVRVRLDRGVPPARSAAVRAAPGVACSGPTLPSGAVTGAPRHPTRCVVRLAAVQGNRYLRTGVRRAWLSIHLSTSACL